MKHARALCGDAVLDAGEESVSIVLCFPVCVQDFGGQFECGFRRVGEGIGQGGQTFQAAEAAWTSMAGANQTAWDNAAAVLSPPIQAVPTFEAGGVPGTPYTAGKVFYVYSYALSRCGVGPVPGQTPPVYA